MSDNASPTPPDDDVAQMIQQIRDLSAQLQSEIGKVIVGQQDVIDQLLMALLCKGHAVLVGVPGLAKTLLVSTLERLPITRVDGP